MRQKPKKILNNLKCNYLITSSMLKRRKLAASSIAKVCDFEFRIRVIK